MTTRRRTDGRAPSGPARAHADRPDECRDYLEGVAELDGDVIEALAGQLRDARRELGPQRGNEEWMDGPLDEWLDHIDRGVVDLDEETLAALAVGMHEVLAMRDALILSLILARSVCGRDALMAVLSRPRTPEVSRLVRDLLSGAFHDERGPDRTRCQAGVTMLVAMTRLMPAAMSAQPFAAIAYVLWWLGDGRAPLYALRSLASDDGCTLAAIVLSASERGVRPACLAARA